MMKILVLAAFMLPFLAYAGQRELQPDLKLRSKSGVEIIISYSAETLHGMNTFGLDIHIEEISLHANGLNHFDHANVFINGHKVRLDCDGQFCHRKAIKTDLRQSLFSQNVYFLGYRSQPTVREVFASVQLNENFWLEDPVRNDTIFKLMIKDRP